jgi:hypothetical protein
MSASSSGGLVPSLGTASATVRRWGGWAIGMGTPGQQLLANLVVFLIALISSTVTLGATLIIAVFALIFGAIAVLRFIPQLNALWPLGG